MDKVPIMNANIILFISFPSPLLNSSEDYSHSISYVLHHMAYRSFPEFKQHPSNSKQASNIKGCYQKSVKDFPLILLNSISDK